MINFENKLLTLAQGRQTRSSELSKGSKRENDCQMKIGSLLENGDMEVICR